MNGKKELAILVVSLLLFLFDFGFDIYVAIQYDQEGEDLWSSLTMYFIIIPHVAMSIVACIITEINKDESRFSRFKKRAYAFIRAFFTSLLWNFYQEFKLWKRRYWNKCPCEATENSKNCTGENCENFRQLEESYNKLTYEMSRLRYVETIAESAPQWCLQVSIMFNLWSFPWYVVISVSLSFFSLAFSITNMEKKRIISQGEDFKFIPRGIIFFILQSFTLFSRLFAIVIFTKVHGAFILLLLLHWSIVNFFYGKSYLKELYDIFKFFMFYYPVIFPCTFPFLLHPTRALHEYLLNGDKDPPYWCLHGLTILEDLAMTMVAVFVTPYALVPDKHMSVIRPLALRSILPSMAGSIILTKVYYRAYYKPPQNDD